MDWNVTQNCSLIFNNVSCSTSKADDQIYIPTLKAGAKTFFIVGLVLTWIWTVLIVSLNVAVIITICSYKKRSRLYFYLMNLAIADLACGVFDAFPHAMERTLGYRYILQVWIAGEVACKIQRTLANTCAMASNYLLATMSMDRAYVVCRPMSTLRKGKFLPKVITFFCWILSFVCSTPFLKYHVTKNWKEEISFVDEEWCTLTYNGDVVRAYEIRFYLMFTFMFCVPLVIISGSYILLIISMCRRALHQTPSKKRQERTEKDGLTMTRVFNNGLPKSKVKSIKLTLGIVLSFLICWMAYFVAYFLSYFAKVYHPVLVIMTTFYFLNSIANPILFFIYHKKTVRTLSSPSLTSSKNSRKRYTSNTEVTGSIRNQQKTELVVLNG